MRKGINPSKQAKLLEAVYHHRVVIPVYIPDSGEDYYAELDQVLKLCVESLVATADNRLAITLVNNGSHDGIIEIMDQWHRAGIVDTVIHHAHNIGKIDALIGAARGAREPLITLCDADIFFRRGWQKAVEEVFLNFPDAGSVSPIPTRTGLFYGTSPALRKILLGKYRFRFEALPENAADYDRYFQSINWRPEEGSSLKKWPIISTNSGFEAIVGSGHQILTIKRSILMNHLPKNPSFCLIGGNSEYLYVDEPVEKSGCLRLATMNNYAYHMGNLPESEFCELLKENQSQATPMNNVLQTFGNSEPRSSPPISDLKFKMLKRLSKVAFKKRYGIKDYRY